MDCGRGRIVGVLPLGDVGTIDAHVADRQFTLYPGHPRLATNRFGYYKEGDPFSE